MSHSSAANWPLLLLSQVQEKKFSVTEAPNHISKDIFLFPGHYNFYFFVIPEKNDLRRLFATLGS